MDQGLKQSDVIGRNIRKHRIEMKYTQEQLSAKLQTMGCDISRGTLAKIESGIRHVSVYEIECIRKLLAMKYEDFFSNNR